MFLRTALARLDNAFWSRKLVFATSAVYFVGIVRVGDLTMNKLERFKNQWSNDEWKELLANTEFAVEWSSQRGAETDAQNLTKCGELAPVILYGDAKTRAEFQLLSSLRNYR